MAAPQYVPNTLNEQPRRGLAIPASEGWVPGRPAELDDHQPVGRELGRPGPDQGFALKLAKGYHGQLQLTAGEKEHDVVTGCVVVAMVITSSATLGLPCFQYKSVPVNWCGWPGPVLGVRRRSRRR